MTRPLDGIRVLDFTRHMAGPYGTMLLGDYGADVIKVESLPDGDGSRSVGTAFVGDESALFLIWNRGKRSIAIDMRTREGLEAVRKLAAQADVVFTSYRPGVADKIGIGYDDLSAINDQLVYVAVSAFGDQGPLAPYPGTDPVVQAMSGVMSVTGESDRGPSLVGVPMADFTGAMVGAQAAMLGLFARDRTGKGQFVDVSMLYALLSSLTTRLASHWVDGEDPPRHGSAHSVVVPYEAFETSDGHVVAGVWGGAEGWQKFCNAIGEPQLADDERYLTNPQRVAARAELTEYLQAIFLARTSAEWETSFNAEGALFGPVHTFSQILAHPQVQQAGLVQTVDHPTLGEIPQLGPVIFLRDTPGEISGPPPLLGQHSEEVLHEVGYTAEETAAMLEAGVIGQNRPTGSG
jgi:crotonobetainyl-CoA:carnitine CoA-transferase CaiB-like acyl-CoA transferase